MKLAAVLLFPSLAFAQQSATTSAPCSPIAPDNKGTITIKCPGMSKEQSQAVLAILNKIRANQLNADVVMSRLDQLIATQAELRRLIESLGDKMKPEALLAKYPLGYVIFEIGYTEEVFPYQRVGLEDFTIDWNSAGVTNLPDNQFALSMPNITKKQSRLDFRDNATGGDKRMRQGILSSWIFEGIKIVAELPDCTK